MTRNFWRLLFLLVLTILTLPLHDTVEAQSLDQKLIGPYWTTQGGHDTLVVINNPKSEPSPVDLLLYSQTGRLLKTQQLHLGPSESTNLSLRSLLAHDGSGFLEVKYSSEMGLVPGQAHIVRGDSRRVVDLVDSRVILGRADIELLSLIPNIRKETHSPQTTTLVLTNVGNRAVHGKIKVTGLPDEKEISFAVGPRKSQEFVIMGVISEESGTLRIPAEEGLLVSGETRSTAGSVPLSFSGTRSGEVQLLGFFSGPSPRLLLWNADSIVAEVDVAVVGQGGESPKIKAALAPEEVMAIDLASEFSLSVGSSGVVLVQTNSRVTGRILADDNSVSSSMKEPVVSSNLAYNFPVRLGPEVGTVLDLFNPTIEEKPIGVFLKFGTEGYTYPRQSLGAGEFLSIDLRELQLSRDEDKFGRTIPVEVSSGTATVMLVADEGEIVARARLQEPLGEVSLESCVTCPLGTTDIAIFPNPVVGSVDTTQLLNLIMTMEDGSLKGTFASRAFTGNIFIADIIGSPPTISFISDGTTSIDAERDACFFYTAELNGPFKGGCTCAFDGTFFDTGTVISRGPKGFDVTVTSSPIPGESQSVVSGQVAKVRVRVRDALGQTMTSYRGTVSFSSGDAGAVLPSPYTFTATDQGIHTFDVTLKTVAGTSPTRGLTVSDASAGIQKTELLFVWFEVSMDAEFWKNCDFMSCPDLGSYVCTSACQVSGFPSPTPFLALTTSSASVCGRSVQVNANGITVTTTVQDKGPVLDRPYWNDGNIPAIGGCVSDALMDQLGIANGCTAGGLPFGRADIRWRFN